MKNTNNPKMILLLKPNSGLWPNLNIQNTIRGGNQMILRTYDVNPEKNYCQNVFDPGSKDFWDYLI